MARRRPGPGPPVPGGRGSRPGRTRWPRRACPEGARPRRWQMRTRARGPAPGGGRFSSSHARWRPRRWPPGPSGERSPRSRRCRGDRPDKAPSAEGRGIPMMPAHKSGAARSRRTLGQAIGVALVDERELAVAAVSVQPVKPGAVQRFSSPRIQNLHTPQVRARPARVSRRAHPPRSAGVSTPGGHMADDLVAGHDTSSSGGESPSRGEGPCGRPRRQPPRRGSRSARLANRALDQAQRALRGRRRVVKCPDLTPRPTPLRRPADRSQARGPRATSSATSVTRCTLRPRATA